MSTVIPPTAPPPPATPAAAAGPVSVTVVADAGAVQLLDKALLELIALARAAKGVVVAATPDGAKVELRAPQPLPPIPEGAKLLLQVLGSGDEAQVRLLAVNGRPLPGVVLPPGLPAPGAAMAGAAIGKPALAIDAAIAQKPILVGSGPVPPLGITATMVRPAVAAGSPAPATTPPTAFSGGLPLDLPPGTQVTVRIAEIGGTAPGTAPLPLSGAPTVPPPAANGAGPAAAPQPAAAPVTPGQIPPAQPGPLPSPQAAPPASPPAPAATPWLTGTVVAQSPGGQAVVQTPVGTLSLPTQTNLAPGTTLVLEVVGKPVPPLPPPLSASPPTGLGAAGWPTLTLAVDTLKTAAQPQAVEDLLRVLPQAGPRLAATMAAFAGALRTGSGRSLLPDSALRGLEKAGRKDLAERLTADLEALGEEPGRPVGGGEWRGFTMPFLHDGAIEPIRLFVRAAGRDGGGTDRRSGGTGADDRFILDISLTRLGRLQMDGLVRRADKHFDLIIRTDAPLELDIRREIQGIFANASELVGTKGSVSFQAGGRWIEFPPAPPPRTRIEA